MKLVSIILPALLWVVAVSALAVPDAEVEAFPPARREPRELWKRKGGGGGGGGKGGSSGGGKGGSSSSGGKGGSSSGGRSSPGSSSSNVGGATKTGSGPPPAYGGNRYYGGGASVPYRSGGPSPLGIAPFFLAGAALAFWPGWLFGANLYHYPHPHTYYNQTAGQNQTMPVACACDPYQECGCDENNSTAYYQDLVGNGTDYNRSLIAVADVNGTETLLINGTLPNGTTASGGTEDAFGAAGGMRALMEAAGYWPMIAAVVATVLLT